MYYSVELFWMVNPCLLSFTTDFHSHRANLHQLNKSYIVLLPKKEVSTRASDFRPISLQNTAPKIISKALTSRLQPLIPLLVHDDQTGFIKGRSISENFVYAADIVQSCHKRKAPAVVLKLDFRKAFNSVSWAALDAVLEAKGFPQLWRNWIRDLSSTSQSAVLLNGKPGNWIQCRRGLRQSDPLSPYLFILVADTLQRLILLASSRGELCHPLSPHLPCPVLQYADDTLIILQGELEQIICLKNILSSFSSFSGLHINFDKSTFIPLNIPPPIAAEMASTLGCPISSFPQPYLGLPLTATKIRISDLQPLLNRFDNYFAGWRGHLLSQGGREVLVNAVQSNFPIYSMCSILLPKGAIDIIDAKRRAFLWTGDKKCSGAACKAPWDLVLLPKSKGGLGIKDLHVQNKCLLQKFLLKLHEPPTAPWQMWFSNKYDWSSSSNLGDVHSSDTAVWLGILDGLPDFRHFTSVQVGDGAYTSFWHDHWLGRATLMHSFPALYSHSRQSNISHLCGQSYLWRLPFSFPPPSSHCCGHG